MIQLLFTHFDLKASHLIVMEEQLKQVDITPQGPQFVSLVKKIEKRFIFQFIPYAMGNDTEPTNDEERGTCLQAHGFWWEINPTFVSDLCK